MELSKLDNIKKIAMVEAMTNCLGIVSDACKTVGISRTLHYNWMQEDPLYKAEIESIADFVLDFVEGKLHGLIKTGDTAATLFYMKTKGKKRGYIERSEVDMSGNVGVNINQLLDDGCEPIK